MVCACGRLTASISFFPRSEEILAGEAIRAHLTLILLPVPHSHWLLTQPGELACLPQGPRDHQDPLRVLLLGSPTTCAFLFAVPWSSCLTAIVFQERHPSNSVFNEVYGKTLSSSSKGELPPTMAPQETSLYSLFEGTPWSPSLPASSGTSLGWHERPWVACCSPAGGMLE